MPSFRIASTSDLPAIVQIENAAGFNHWNASQLQDSLIHHTVYVAEHDSALSGFAVFHDVLDEVELLNIVVLPEEQGKGIGKALLQYGLQQFVQKGALHCFLEVGVTNQSAIALYRYCRFGQVGLRKDYYHRAHGKEDAIVMQLDLRRTLCKN